MATMEAQILSKKLVKPSAPTTWHLQTMKLSLIYQIIPPTYINMVFYYSPAGDQDSREKSKARVAQLEKSLSEALTKFYPLAGRLVMEDLLVDCNDQGVEFLEARVNGELADFLGRGPNVELLDQFVPWEIGAGDDSAARTPLAAVQINMFDCGGLVVGVRVSHKVADSFSIITFVNGWATANREGIKSVIFPSFDLGSLFPTSNLLPINPPSTKKNGAKIVTRRFFFGGAAIQSLMDKARAAAGVSALQPPTPVVLVAALTWKALISVAQVKHGHLRASLLAHPMDLRGKTGISIPENSFGNLPILFLARFMAEESKMELHELVSLLGDSKRNSDHAKTSNVDDLCSMVSGSFREARKEKLYNHRVDVHLCASWCELPLHEADFGWGKPIWVSSTSQPYEVVSLINNKFGCGIEAWVSLNEKDMLGFERDPDILAFTSQ